MNEMEAWFEAQRVAGEARVSSGIEIAAIGIVLFFFGITVPMRPNVSILMSFALVMMAFVMIVSGRKKARLAMEGLMRELQRG
ncbi:hypothetical protein [Sinomonas gamaensis]|uniref:hypothetical protein n=1 Tax=Sinomonas gamaensis TaxID=2565624 RepID=UPI0011086A6C|nr:hypothetical protein [Sinomonas gamaensis]